MIGVKRCVNVSITVAAVKLLRIDKTLSVSRSAIYSLYCVCDDTVLILTSQGMQALEDELQDLKVVKRKEIAQKIKEAREQGDLSELSGFRQFYNIHIVQ